MSCLTIKVDIELGTSFDVAAKEAADLARTLNIKVEFLFNERRYIAQPNEQSFHDLINKFNKITQQPGVNLGYYFK